MYSATQSANLGKMLGLILMLTGHQVDDTAISGFLEVCGAIIAALAVALSWLHRWSKGDIKFSGVRK